MNRPARWSWVALPLLALACVAAPAGTSALQLSRVAVPTLLIRLNYNGVVMDVRTPEPEKTAAADPPPKASQLALAPGKSSRAQSGKALSCKGVVLIAPQQSDSGDSFCVGATTEAIAVAFTAKASVPYATEKSVTCTPLNGASDGSPLFSVYARVGRDSPSGDTIYDGGRAKCDLGPGFDYAYTVEKQGAGQSVPADAANQVRTISVPWSLLHLDYASRAIMLNAGGYQFIIPLKIYEGGASVSTDYAPYVRLSTPSPGAQSLRARQVELNMAFSPNRHHLLLASFAQNQSTVSVQRALSNALSLAPVSLGSPVRMSIGQDLQTQSQTLFTFLQPSVFLEDQSLKGLFDSTPFSVNKLSNLASGYAYGFSSDPFTAGAFYGLQSPGAYSGGATATFILTTPAPSPEPPPPGRAVTANEAPQHQALHPPPPPGPYFESGTESTPPFELAFTNAFNGSKGARDVLDALAFETHLYHNQSSRGSDYSAQTFNLFGRVEHDFHSPAVTNPGSVSRFVGQSATFTSSNAANRYFQLRETAGVQLNDRFFTPTSGSASWLTPLSGPVGHLTAALAAGKKAHYYALDLIAFRLTNSAGDLAAQEGWQITVPIADPGWLLSGGTLTQTVSDRIAAINQGLVSGYSGAITQVPSTLARPQRLANVSLLSPELDLGSDWKLNLAGGYNTGTVTACGATSSARNAKFQCLTVVDNRTVGGISLSHGNLLLGATDTAIQSGALSAGNAAQNLGTSGGLPGSVTGYISLQGCPQISAAYANAAMVSGIPFPQQGSTLSSQFDYPLAFHNERFDVLLGYFNERALTNPSFNDSGFSAVIRLGTAFGAVPRCPTK